MRLLIAALGVLFIIVGIIAFIAGITLEVFDYQQGRPRRPWIVIIGLLFIFGLGPLCMIFGLDNRCDSLY